MSNEFKINIHLLHTLTAATIRGMDKNPIHEFIQHSRSQLREIRVLLCQCQKLSCPFRVLLELLQIRLVCRQNFFQLCLLLFVFTAQKRKALFFQTAHGIGFIELFNQHIQL